MTPRLTIAIPSYKRAELLDEQLAWLTSAISGLGSLCRLFVADNCSPDHTADVVEKWRRQCRGHVEFRSTRHSTNLGPIKNIAHCIRAAETRYVWVIGDDDRIEAEAIPYVLSKIDRYPDLSLAFLNFSGRHALTGRPVHPPTIEANRWFDVACEDGAVDGKEIFAHCFATSVGAVMFLTASVYRTAVARDALARWPGAVENWICLAYLAGVCAAAGRVVVSRATYAECKVGVSFWQKDPRAAFLMQYADTSEVLLQLRAAGYSEEFCRRMIVASLRNANLRVLGGALRRWPLYTTRRVVPYFALVGRAAVGSLPALRPA